MAKKGDTIAAIRGRKMSQENLNPCPGYSGRELTGKAIDEDGLVALVERVYSERLSLTDEAYFRREARKR